MPEAIEIVMSALAGGQNATHNMSATVDPGVNDDQTKGFSTASAWFNKVTGNWWTCASAATGAASWTALTAGSSTPTDATLIAMFNKAVTKFDRYSEWAADNDGTLKLQSAPAVEARSSDINFGLGYAAGDTSLVVDDGSQFNVGDVLSPDGSDELVEITNIVTNTLTVTRGAYGTTAGNIDDNVTMTTVGANHGMESAAQEVVEVSDDAGLIMNAALLTALSGVTNLTIMIGVVCASGVDVSVEINANAAGGSANAAILTVSEDNQAVLVHKRGGTAGSGDAHTSSLADTLKVFRGYFPSGAAAQLQVGSNDEQEHTSAAGTANLITSGGTTDQYQITTSGGTATISFVAFFDGDVHPAQEATIRALASDSEDFGADGTVFYAIGE